MMVRIFDDYGFSSLTLKYTIVTQGQPSEEHVAMLHYSDRIKTEGEVEFNWDLDKFHLYPGDYVIYYYEVADNDKISGPKITQSRQYVARLPSLDEIVMQAESESSQRIDKTENLLKTGHEITEQMAKAMRKLKAQQKHIQKTDWQNQKEISNIAEKNAQMLKDIEKMAEQMEKSVDKLADNSLLNRDILEKLAQIQKLFQEVATPEMKEAQRRLMDELKNMDRQSLEKAAEDFQLSQEEMLQRLERTLALLKKMQLEQKMQAMMRKVEEMLKQQESVNDKADSSKKDDLPYLSKDEDKINSSLKDLKKEVDELNELARDAKMEKSPEVSEFSESIKKTDADQNMAQMSQALGKKKKKDAKEQGEQAQNKLQDMLDKMQEQLAEMTGDEQEDIEKMMQAAIDDANYLSKEQESLLNETNSVSQQSIALHDLATTQQDIKSACNGLRRRINDLGKQSPFVAAELHSIIQSATDRMDFARQCLSNKKRGQAISEQRNAMAALNLAAIRMMESLEQQKQCKKSGQCDKKMSLLQSLCDKQKKLCEKTKQCNKPGSQCNKPGQSNPQVGEQGQQAVQRLAGEQGAIRKSIEELAAEFGNSRQILGRLDDIAREMKDIEDALGSGEIGQDIVQRQLRIHSRMLEASRSLQRRDFTEQRKAAAAESNAFFVPDALTNDMLGEGINLDDRLRRYLSGKYPPQYEEQIKAYFKALLQIESNLQSPATRETP